MRAKIGKRVILAQKDAFIIWDEEIKGFYARRQTKAGRITFGFRYTDVGGKKREVRIGDYPTVTIDDARDAAKIEAGKVAKSEDPAAERDALRAQKTLAEVWADFEDKALHTLSETTQRLYKDQWALWIEPDLGAKKALELTPGDVEGLHKKITEEGKKPREVLPFRPRGGRKLKDGSMPNRGGRSPKVRYAKKRGGATCANRVVALLSILCNRAGLAKNPCKGVKRNREFGKKVHFSDADLMLIVTALGEQPEPDQIAFYLFLETPVRHMTVCAAEWDEFSGLGADAPIWRIPGAKLKGKRDYVAHLSSELGRRILAYKRRVHNETPLYLFPKAGQWFEDGHARESNPDEHRTTFKHSWKRIRARALELAGPDNEHHVLKVGTPHTFKHTYLTRFAELGASAPEIQKVGDHKDIRTSMGYVHRAEGRIRELAAQISARLPKAAA